MIVAAAQICYLGYSMVKYVAVYGEQVASELPRGKRLGAWSLGIWRPLDLFTAPYSSPEKYFIQPASHPASKITWCSILLKVKATSYCKWYFIHIHIIQQYEILFRPHSFHEYCVPKQLFHVSRTTRFFLGWFGDEHHLRHEGYLAPRLRCCFSLHIH